MEGARRQVPHLRIDLVETEHVALTAVAGDGARTQSDDTDVQRSLLAHFPYRQADAGFGRIIADGFAESVRRRELPAVNDIAIAKHDDFWTGSRRRTNGDSQRAVKIPDGNENIRELSTQIERQRTGQEHPEIEREEEPAPTQPRRLSRGNAPPSQPDHEQSDGRQEDR